MKSRNIIYVFVFLTSISTYSQESLTLEEYKEKVLNYSQIYKQSITRTDTGCKGRSKYRFQRIPSQTGFGGGREPQPERYR